MKTQNDKEDAVGRSDSNAGLERTTTPSQRAGRLIGCVGHDCDDCKKRKREVTKLRHALQRLSDMYARTWDCVDGSLIMMNDGIKEFEAAHAEADKVLRYNVEVTGRPNK